MKVIVTNELCENEILTSKTLIHQYLPICSDLHKKNVRYNFGHHTVQVSGETRDERL